MIEQSTLFDEPAGAVRATDPPTSRDAAAIITGRTEHLILAVIPAGGATDDELVALLPDVYPPTLKSARSRLSNKRLLIDSGITRCSTRGCSMTVWRLS